MAAIAVMFDLASNIGISPPEPEHHCDSHRDHGSHHPHHPYHGIIAIVTIINNIGRSAFQVRRFGSAGLRFRSAVRKRPDAFQPL